MIEDCFSMKSFGEEENYNGVIDYNCKIIEKLIDEYKDLIFNLLYRMTYNYDDALDLVQETFIQAYKSLPNFRYEASLKTWIYKIAFNLALRHNKKWKFFKIINFGKKNKLISNCKNPEDSLSEHQLSEYIQSAINKLPPDQKAIILLREIDELSYEEIAEIMNIPIGTVKSRLSRARYYLKKVLKNNGIIGKKTL